MRSEFDSQAQLAAVIRKNLLRLLISLVILGAVAAGIVLYFRQELDATTAWAFETLGIYGLIGLIFITDAFVSPFPPDTVLLLIASSSYAEHWYWLIPLIGAISTCAGFLGYWLGRFVADHPRLEPLLGPFRKQSEDLIRRFGPWAVALGAMTPIPFSITCWSAGLLQVPWRRVWPACLLRIPRYVIYYSVIGASTNWFG